MKKKIMSLLVGGIVLGSSCATIQSTEAHGIWLEQRVDKIQLVLGEGPEDNAYNPSMVKSMRGFDKDYHPLVFRRINRNDHIVFSPPENLAVVYTQFDYGYFSKGTDGKFVPKPMKEVPGATMGTHAIKYATSYLKPVSKVQASPSMKYQLVPSQDPSTLEVGDTLRVQLLKDGQPFGNVDLIADVKNHHTVIGTFDKNGYADVVIKNGSVNVIGAEFVNVYKKSDGLATQDKIFVSLSFTLHPTDPDE